MIQQTTGIRTERSHLLAGKQGKWAHSRLVRLYHECHPDSRISNPWKEAMRRLISTLVAAGAIAAALSAVTASPSAANSVRITGGGGTTSNNAVLDNREW
ncbi:hypothetical protein ACSDR0_50885 [Streptosporangium sp. G11]|uniref:hypothetical protein n=1 Tax=Streptosporangium sp. G11 TaxID=3436926 RepID=UPI003EB766EF